MLSETNWHLWFWALYMNFFVIGTSADFFCSKSWPAKTERSRSFSWDCTSVPHADCDGGITFRRRWHPFLNVCFCVHHNFVMVMTITACLTGLIQPPWLIPELMTTTLPDIWQCVDISRTSLEVEGHTMGVPTFPLRTTHLQVGRPKTECLRCRTAHRIHRFLQITCRIRVCMWTKHLM